MGRRESCLSLCGTLCDAHAFLGRPEGGLRAMKGHKFKLAHTVPPPRYTKQTYGLPAHTSPRACRADNHAADHERHAPTLTYGTDKDRPLIAPRSGVPLAARPSLLRISTRTALESSVRVRRAAAGLHRDPLPFCTLPYNRTQGTTAAIGTVSAMTSCGVARVMTTRFR